MSALPNQPARLNLRIPAQHKALIERAAAALGVTLSDFVIAELVKSAQRTLDEGSVTRLNAEQSRAFLRLLANPPKPNAALLEAARRYRARNRSQSGSPSKRKPRRA